jgi:hypothetical protein
MKTPHSSKRKNRAFIANTMVFSIAMVIVSGLALAFRSHVRSLDVQAKSQVKIDYAQKEDALLRALLQIVPNKAIGAMQTGSNLNPAFYSWDTIFSEAIQLSNAETAIDANMLGSLGTASGVTPVSGNTGDGSLGAVSSFVSPISGTGSLVNPGDTRETAMLSSSISGKLPAPLYATSGTDYSRDRQYPIISLTKTHSASWTKGIQLSPADYPRYNLYTYPNIRFGYARPGDLFVAKRNWWAFSMKFGGANSIGVPTVKKNYLLSIYEVPSQLPISSAGFMSVGQHEDGTAWNDAQVTGGVYADRLQTQGTVSVTDGLFSARSSLNFSNSTSVNGVNLSNNFDALGVRESRETQATGNFHQASLGGNVGKVAFIPLNTGSSFLAMQTDGAVSTRLSSTGWNDYTNGAIQSQMRIEIRNMQSLTNQIPTSIRFHYRNTSGSLVYQTYTRNSNWPTENQSGGSAFPFQTAVLDIGRRVLIVHLDRLPAFLASRGNAADLTVNNSLHIYPNSTRTRVVEPSIPSLSSDVAVALRGGSDMSAFTEGFSLVTNLRTYVSESLNTVPIMAPANAGLPAGEPYYPPISLFAPEKRFGESMSFNHPIDFSGQVNSLKLSTTDAFRPLDLVSAGDETVHAQQIEADLKMLKSPAQLPPIHLMNWLVTIEEIHAGEAN